MDLVADLQDEIGSGGSALFSDISTPTRSWKQIDVRQESKQRESPPRKSSSSPATPRTSQKGVRSTSKGGRSKSPTSAEFRAAIKEKNKMEMEIGEYQKTLDEMSAAMANLHQEDYGSTIRIQELERRCEIASKQSGHLVSHHQHHMAEAWRKFEEEAQQMRKVEMNAYQYGEKKDMESNVIIQQMRQAEGTIMEQKREIAVMKSYMASEKPAAQESAIRANQIHREASQQISVYQQQIRGIESSTSIEKFNEEEMVQSLKSQLEHALVKRPETCSMEDSREQLMARLNDVTTFAEQESKRAECLLRKKEEIVKQYESDVLKKDQMIAIEGSHRQDAILELAQVREAKQEERTMDEKSKEAEYWRLTAKGVYDEHLEEMRQLQGQLKDREATLKQEESFVRQLDADNEELRALKKLETQEASSSKDGHRERAVVKRAEGGPQANSTRVDKRVTGLFPSSSLNLIPNSSLIPGSILFPSYGHPMIDVHLSQMQGVVGHAPQSATTTGGSGDGGGNNGTTPPLDYGGFSPNANRQGAGRRQLSLTGGGGGPPDDPPDDEDEDDDDEEDEEDEEEEEEEDDNRTRRRRRRSRDDREIKSERPRISRKEAERVSIPAWPKIHQLDNWKMQLLMNVLSADPDTDTWTKWLEQALGLNPGLNLLSDSDGDRFATIDIKMAMGMQNMLKQAPDEAKDVYLDATRHSELRHQQGVIVKGRELVALVMQSFRTSDRTDLVYHIEHLFNLDFPGDKNLVIFRNKWYDLLLKMRSEDRPSKLALRDILYRKIKGSKKMDFGLNAYHRLPDKHPQKTYEFLLALIDHQIKADREDLMLDMKEKSVKSMMKSGGRDAAPATGKQENQGGKGRKGKPSGPDAAPVLPKAKAKGHAGKNGKSDGASDRGKSPGGGKDNPCWYRFKAAKGCVKGNECTFSHSKKTEHKLENKGKSKSRSSSPKRDDGACFAFQKGKCDKGSACKYRHELIKNNSAPATSSDKAQAKSKAAAKAAAPAIARRAIAMPAIVLKQSGPAGKVSFKKDVDQVEPDEAETVYHEHDDDVMSESSRWSGESEIPEKMVWFKEVLDVDENGEITYLEDERRQWERRGEGHGYEDNEMSLISTCTSTRRCLRAVIIENYQPIKSNDH